MSKKMLLWIGIGVAVYMLFIRKADATHSTTPMVPTAELPPAFDIPGSTAQMLIGELGSALGVQQ